MSATTRFSKRLYGVFALFLLFCTITACSEAPATNAERFTLTGELTGDYDGWVYLNYGDTKDSTRLENGQFVFTGRADEPVQGALHLAPPSGLEWIYLENAPIRFAADHAYSGTPGTGKHTFENARITGSASQDMIYESQDLHRRVDEDLHRGDSLYAYLQRKIEVTRSHPAVGSMIASSAISSSWLTPEQLASLYTQFDTSRMSARDKVAFRIGMANRTSYGVGDIFPDLPLQDETGRSVSITDFRGKHVLVDFWASWCGPCRQNHPNLKSVVADRTVGNLEVVSISIDADKAQWARAAREDDLTWTSLWDVEHEVEKQLAISGLPQSYLLDATGVITHVNLALENVVEKTR